MTSDSENGPGRFSGLLRRYASGIDVNNSSIVLAANIGQHFLALGGALRQIAHQAEASFFFSSMKA